MFERFKERTIVKDLKERTIGVVVREGDISLQYPPQIAYEGGEGFVSALLAEKFEILGEFQKPLLEDIRDCGAGVENGCCGSLGLKNGKPVCHLYSYILVGANNSWSDFLEKNQKRTMRPFCFYCLRPKNEEE